MIYLDPQVIETIKARREDHVVVLAQLVLKDAIDNDDDISAQLEAARIDELSSLIAELERKQKAAGVQAND